MQIFQLLGKNVFVYVWTVAPPWAYCSLPASRTHSARHDCSKPQKPAQTNILNQSFIWSVRQLITQSEEENKHTRTFPLRFRARCHVLERSVSFLWWNDGFNHWTVSHCCSAQASSQPDQINEQDFSHWTPLPFSCLWPPHSWQPPWGTSPITLIPVRSSFPSPYFHLSARCYISTVKTKTSAPTFPEFSGTACSFLCFHIVKVNRLSLGFHPLIIYFSESVWNFFFFYCSFSWNCDLNPGSLKTRAATVSEMRWFYVCFSISTTANAVSVSQAFSVCLIYTH